MISVCRRGARNRQNKCAGSPHVQRQGVQQQLTTRRSRSLNPAPCDPPRHQARARCAISTPQGARLRSVGSLVFARVRSRKKASATLQAHLSRTAPAPPLAERKAPRPPTAIAAASASSQQGESGAAKEAVGAAASAAQRGRYSNTSPKRSEDGRALMPVRSARRRQRARCRPPSLHDRPSACLAPSNGRSRLPSVPTPPPAPDVALRARAELPARARFHVLASDALTASQCFGQAAAQRWAGRACPRLCRSTPTTTTWWKKSARA